MSLSDVMCQELVKQSNPITKTAERKESNSGRLDSKRILQVAMTGFVWSGPITHFWYALLEQIYSRIATIFSIHSPAVAMLVKRILFSPTVVTGYFMVRSFLEGYNDWIGSARENLQTEFRPTLYSAWKFWPAVNSINFYFVPLPFRVLYMNVFSLLWSSYLIYEKRE